MQAGRREADLATGSHDWTQHRFDQLPPPCPLRPGSGPGQAQPTRVVVRGHAPAEQDGLYPVTSLQQHQELTRARSLQAPAVSRPGPPLPPPGC